MWWLAWYQLESESDFHVKKTEKKKWFRMNENAMTEKEKLEESESDG